MNRRSPGVMLALFVVVVLATVGIFGGCTPASWGAWHTHSEMYSGLLR